MSWKKDIVLSVRTGKDLVDETGMKFEKREALFFERVPDSGLVFSVPRYYLSLMGKEPDDPVRLQCIPRVDELNVKPYELYDPLGEDKYKISDRLIHRYRDRVLFLVTDMCAMYCRHCFRRNFTGGGSGSAGKEEIAAASRYIGEHKEVKEVILSGGDPLTLDSAVLDRILSAFKNEREDIIFRIGTRIPVVLPSRVDIELIETLKKYSPLYIMTQFNHVKELSDVSIEACRVLIDSGIPVYNQSVLLRGVNDSVKDLEKLFHKLVSIRVKPYYLFQGDLAPGTAHMRVPLKKGLMIMKELRRLLSGLSLPVYAVDLPGGGGKIPLTENYIGALTERGWELFDGEGRMYIYPEEQD